MNGGKKQQHDFATNTDQQFEAPIKNKKIDLLICQRGQNKHLENIIQHQVTDHTAVDK